MTPPRLQLRVLRPSFVINHMPDRIGQATGPWLAQVRAPEGLTVIREADDDRAGDRWIALYGGNPHGLDVPGMLAAVVGPLASSRVPVFVASTYHADVVLVPADRFPDAVTALRAAGHEVADG